MPGIVSGLMAELLELVSAELGSVESRKAIRTRIMHPVLTMLMWELLPWVVAVWAVTTLGSVLATLTALRMFL